MSHPALTMDDFPATGKGGSFPKKQPPFRLDDEVMLECEEGYSPPSTTTARVILKNGRLEWRPAELHCTSDLVDLPITGKLGSWDQAGPPPYHRGDKVTFLCGPGYADHILESTVTVQNGKLAWTPDTLNCEPLPGLNDLPETGAKGRWVSYDPKPYALNAGAGLSCDRGYLPALRKFTSRVVEKDGRLVWEPPRVECEPAVGLTFLPDTGDLGYLKGHSPPYHLFDKVEYVCELPPNYTMISAVLMNKKGELHWVPSLLQCPVQPPPMNPSERPESVQPPPNRFFYIWIVVIVVLIVVILGWFIQKSISVRVNVENVI